MHVRAFVSCLGKWSVGAGPLHGKLSRAIQAAIQQATLPVGTRLPAERALAQALAVSRTTVVSAYAALQESGFLESRRGSGTYVRTHASIANAARQSSQAQVTVSSPLMGMFLTDPDTVIDMAVGCPFPLTELPRDLFRLSDEEQDVLLQDRMYYPMGLPALRQAIANYYCGIGLPTTSQQILVTNGAQQALSLLALLYLQRNDTVLIEDPTYFGAVDAFRAVGARLSSLPIGDEGVSPILLRERITTTAPRLVYLTPTFQNPTGAVMPASARAAIAQMVANLGTPLIDDNCLADIVLDGDAPLPIAFYGDSENIITIGCLSKLMWPGLRTGWIRAAEGVIEGLARVKTAFELGSPLLTQSIAVKLVQAIPLAKQLRREQLLPRRDALIDLLRRLMPDWEFRRPSGSFFIWVRLPYGDARELAQVAIRHGVVILPGSTMSASGMQTRYLRLPFLSEPATLQIAMERLQTAWVDYRRSAHGPREAIAVI